MYICIYCNLYNTGIIKSFPSDIGFSISLVFCTTTYQKVFGVYGVYIDLLYKVLFLNSEF